MADIKEVGGAVGGTSVIDDGKDPAALIEDSAGLDFLEIDTSGEVVIIGGGGAKLGVGGTPTSMLHVHGGNASVASFLRTGYSGTTEIRSGDGISTIQVGESFALNTDGGTEAFRIDTGQKISTGGEETPLCSAGGIHLLTGTQTGQTAHSDADDLVIESTAVEQGISFLGAANTRQRIQFGDVNNSGQASITFNHNGNDMAFMSSGGQKQFYFLEEGYLQVNTSTPTAMLTAKGSLNTNLSDSTSVISDGTVGTNRNVESVGHGLKIGQAVKIDSTIYTVAALGPDSSASADNFELDGDHGSTGDKGQATTDSNLLQLKTGDDDAIFTVSPSRVGVGTSSPINLLHVASAKPIGIAKFHQTADNQATCFVLSTASTNRGPAIFTTTDASFDDGATYPIIRVVAEASESANIGMIGCYTSGGSEPHFLVKGDGTVSAGTSYAVVHSDYAEYFETTDGGSIAVGSSVVLEGGKVRAAQAGEQPIGVVRPAGTSSVVGNDPWNHWKYRYLRDDFGAYLREAYTITEWTDDDGAFHSYATDGIPDGVIPPADATISSTDKSGEPWMRRIENPDYDESLEYVKREDRDEWVIVGLMGQVPISKGQPLADAWVKLRDVSDSVEFYFIK